MHLVPLEPQASEHAVIIHLEVLFLFSVVPEWKIFHCQVFVWSYQTNKSGANHDWTFLHSVVPISLVLSDLTNMAYSLFFSMTDCQGKNLALFLFSYVTELYFLKKVQTPIIKSHCVLNIRYVACRYDSSGESATDKPMGRTSSYTRRETRLAALNKQEQDSTTKDYKKVVTLTSV